MKQMNYKKLIIPNIPYVFFVYLFDKVGQAARLAPGADISEKILNITQGFSEAFSNALPSVHPLDLLTAEKRSWERQQICRYRSGAKPAAENQPPPQERRIHRRNDFPRPQPPQRLADQHNFLSRRAFCSVPAQTCGNVHFGGLSCRRDCA